jgi:hypothetical protein
MPFSDMLLPLLISRFQMYKSLADKTFSQLKDEHFFYQPNEQSNSIAVIIQHMYGNAMSRFTNFLTEDGEKEWRKRDEEFEAMDLTKEDLLSFWNTGWTTVFNALSSLTEDDLGKTVYIRTEPLLVIDAILRQLAHYSYHIGQIVYIGKMVKENFESLSITKHQSEQYNETLRKP